tara:strand:+ start:314 stop:553 length:240 start_codon:yes stop_codon:yes gene_type:complete
MAPLDDGCANQQTSWRRRPRRAVAHTGCTTEAALHRFAPFWTTATAAPSISLLALRVAEHWPPEITTAKYASQSAADAT